MPDRQRCFWANPKNPLYLRYHDEEWGRPIHDDHKLLELLILESFQAGLSWECILNKREAFRQAFDNFDRDKILAYDDEKIESLMSNSGIIRNRAKITASINNTRIFKDIQNVFGSFDAYLAHICPAKTIYDHTSTTSPLSDLISKDLRRRGMKFVGSTIVYSFLQAIGIINSHQPGCFLYQNRQD